MIASAQAAPFLGLRYFQKSDSDLFFGRDEQVDELLSRLKVSRFVTVLGSSGSGKSSLVSAGLIPALFAGYLATAGSRWRIARATPGNDPIGNLALQLESELAIQGTETTLRRGPLGIVEAVERARLPRGENVLIICDQFEELFRYLRSARGTQTCEQAREDAAVYVKLLLEAAAQRDVSIHIILTMRSDFLGECAQFRNLPERINDGLYLVPRMRRDQIEQAISGPVQVIGGEITPRLVERILNDIGDDQDQLPVLQHALLRTWNARPEGEALDLPHYQAVGGLQNALGRHADEIYHNGLSLRLQHVAMMMFRRLTEVDESREIRRPASMDELSAVTGASPEELRAVIDPFRADGVCFLTVTGTQVDITHESLIRQWSLLREWARQEAVDRSAYERIAEAASTDLAKGLWLRGGQLVRAEEWRRKGLTPAWARMYRGNYDDTARFIERSVRARKVEKGWKIAAGVFAILLTTLVIWMWRGEKERQLGEKARDAAVLGDLYKKEQRARAAATDAIDQLKAAGEKLESTLEQEKKALLTADEERTRATWQTIAHQSIRDIQTHVDDDRAALLAVQAFRLQSGASSRGSLLVEEGLHSILQAPVYGHLLSRTKGQTVDIAFAPDGKNLIGAGRDGTARVWNLGSEVESPERKRVAEEGDAFISPDGRYFALKKNYTEFVLTDLRDPAGPKLLKGGGRPILTPVFSSDGRFMVAAGDGGVSVWDLQRPDGSPSLVRVGHICNIAAISNDGHLVATFDIESHEVILWNRDSTRFLQTNLKPMSVAALSFVPDGKSLAIGTLDGRVLLWRFSTADRETRTLQTHQGTVRRIAFSPDGSTLASAGDDHTVRLWNLRRGETQIATGHRGSVWALVFAPNSHRFASAADDESIIVWDIRRNRPINRERSSYSLAMSPDAESAITGSSEGKVYLWALKNSDAAPKELLDIGGAVTSVAFSPDGRQIVTGGPDSNVKIWDPRKPSTPVEVLKTTGTKVWSAVFSPDGEKLASGTDSSQIQIWNLRRRGTPDSLRGPSQGINRLAFARDGSRLAAAGKDNSVLIWNMRRPGEPPNILRIVTPRKDQANQKEASIQNQEVNEANDIAFSSDGQLLASGHGDQKIRVWDLTNPSKATEVLAGHSQAVLSVAFSPDNRRLASGSADETVRIWDVSRPGSDSLILGTHRNGATAVRFSADGNTLYSTGLDGNLRQWKLGKAAADEVCRSVWRNLTPEEWLRYAGPGIPFQNPCPSVTPARSAAPR